MFKRFSLALWLCIVFSVLSLTAHSATDIKRVEPLNWWVGMTWNSPELLIYGDGIAEYQPKVKYQGVKVKKVTRVENPNYLFVTLAISSRAKPGTIELEFVKGDKRISYSFPLLARDKESAKRQGFSPKDAVYLVTPDRFANGDQANDNHPGMLEKANPAYKGGRHGGDLAGLTQHLDYIAALGFTQIWPNPLVENNMQTYSYHGYAATDFYRIDPRYGSNDDFKNFVQEARARDIGVIKDIVLNHIGSNHWWMKDLPSKDWINQTAQYQETTHRREVVQDIYAADTDKNEFLNGWFVPTMPDLNQRQPQLANYLIQNSIWWIEYSGLSGIREDTYGYADADFLTRWSEAIMTEYPNFSIVGEEWTNNPALIAHWQKGKVNPNGHVSSTNSMMDFPTHDALRFALAEDEGFDTGWIKLYQALANDFLYPDPSMLMVFPENHDTSRIFSYLNEDLALNKMAWVYMATIRGIPQFYYGSEVLMTSPRERDDGAVRAPMYGGFTNQTKNAFTQEGLSHAEKDMQNFVKTLLNWRKHESVIHRGKLMHFVPKNGVYVYFRYTDEKAVMVALSKNKTPIELDLSRFEQVIGSKRNAKNVFSQQSFNLKPTITLEPMSATLIELF